MSDTTPDAGQTPQQDPTAEPSASAGNQPGAADRSAVKDPEDWTTGDEPMTGAQGSYLETLAREAGEQAPEGLSKAQASELIDRLQRQTGRGR